MNSSRMLPRIALLAAAVLFSAALWAQDTASITGTVTDSSGAAVSNAQVSVSNAEHGIKRDATSNGSGDSTGNGQSDDDRPTLKRRDDSSDSN